MRPARGVPGGGTGLVAWPIFKIATEASCTTPVGSIPTRSRHAPPRFRAGVLFCLVLAGATSSLAAQDSTRAVTPPAQDSQPRHKPSATGNMLKSLVVPGWGQLSLGREATAAVFIAAEAGALTMVIRAQHDLNRAKDAGDATLVDQYTRKREDWLVLMGVNHVLSALEAYVSAKLWDFPGELDLQAVPGRVSASASIPIRLP